MRSRFSWIVLAIMVAEFPEGLLSAEIKGKVVQVNGELVLIKVEENLRPSVGDKVHITRLLAGLNQQASVADAEVILLQDRVVVTKVVQKSAAVIRAGYLATIASEHPTPLEASPHTTTPNQPGTNSGGKTDAPKPYSIEGVWEDAEESKAYKVYFGKSSWTFQPSGDGRYRATRPEKEWNRLSGATVVTGNHVRVDWTSADGSLQGYDDWDLAADGTSGKGHRFFTKGDNTHYDYSIWRQKLPAVTPAAIKPPGKLVFSPRPNGRLIFEDRFDTEKPLPDLADRRSYHNAVVSFEHVDGRGRLKAQTFAMGEATGVAYSPPQVKDFIAEFEFQAADGLRKAGYGLVFRGDFCKAENLPDFYYLMLLPALQEVSLECWQGDKWTRSEQHRLLPGQISTTGPNRVRLEAVGSEFRIFVNGAFTWQLTDDKIPAPGCIGLWVAPRLTTEITVYFDKLRIYEVAADRSEPAPETQSSARVATLIQELQDSDAAMRLHAAKSLGQMGGIASGALGALAKRAEGDPDVDVRRVAEVSAILIRAAQDSGTTKPGGKIEGPASYPIAGTWEDAEESKEFKPIWGRSTWTFQPLGDGRYRATRPEDEFGRVRGTAVVTGNRVHVEWVAEKEFKGYDDWELAPDGASGKGQRRIEQHGGPQTFDYSIWRQKTDAKDPDLRIETKPDEKKPDEKKPDEMKPDEKKPDEKKPDEKKPDEKKPDEEKLPDMKPT